MSDEEAERLKKEVFELQGKCNALELRLMLGGGGSTPKPSAREDAATSTNSSQSPSLLSERCSRAESELATARAALETERGSRVALEDALERREKLAEVLEERAEKYQRENEDLRHHIQAGHATAVVQPSGVPASAPTAAAAQEKTDVTIQSLRQEIFRLCQENKSFREREDEAADERRKTEQKFDADKVALRRKAQEAERNTAAVREELAKATEALKAAREEAAANVAKVAELEGKVAEISERDARAAADREKTISELADALRESKEGCSELQAALASEQEELEKRSAEASSLRRQADSMAEELSRSKQEAAELGERSEKQLRAMEETGKKLEESSEQAERLRKQCEEQARKILEAAAAEEQLRALQMQLSEAVEGRSHEAKESERLMTLLQGQNVVIEDLTAWKQGAEKLAETHSEEAAALRKRCEELSAQRQAESSQQSELKESKEKLQLVQSEVDSLRKRLEEAAEGKQRMQSEIRQLKKDVESANEKRENSERITANLTKSYIEQSKSMKRQNEELMTQSQGQLETAQRETEALREELKGLRSTVPAAAVGSMTEEMASRLQALQKERDEKAQQARDFEMSLKIVMGEKSESIAVIESLRKEVRQLKRALAEQEKRISTVAEETPSPRPKSKIPVSPPRALLQSSPRQRQPSPIRSPAKPVITTAPAAPTEAEAPQQQPPPREEAEVVAAAAEPPMQAEDDGGMDHFQVVVSGFSNEANKARVKRQLMELGCAVRAEFDPAITHIVVPSLEVRTMNYLAGIVTSKWVVKDSWVDDSVEKKEMLPESEYGFRCEEPILRGMRVFLKKDSLEPARWAENATQLLTLGRATIADKPENADYAILPPPSPAAAAAPGTTSVQLPSGMRSVTWNDFVDWLARKDFSSPFPQHSDARPADKDKKRTRSEQPGDQSRKSLKTSPQNEPERKK